MRRIYKRWDEWECFKNGFYETIAPANYTPDSARLAYAEFLSDIPRFQSAMRRVVSEWPNSCLHFLTNTEINRIAWMGQAAMCIETGVPSVFRGGFKLLSGAKQKAANKAAEEAIKQWQLEVFGNGNSEENQSVHRAMETTGLF